VTIIPFKKADSHNVTEPDALAVRLTDPAATRSQRESGKLTAQGPRDGGTKK
jgi:hypothetical protein